MRPLLARRLSEEGREVPNQRVEARLVASHAVSQGARAAAELAQDDVAGVEVLAQRAREVGAREGGVARRERAQEALEIGV